eukprot:6406401-Prymnesium_polylepis.1
MGVESACLLTARSNSFAAAVSPATRVTVTATASPTVAPSPARRDARVTASAAIRCVSASARAFSVTATGHSS